MKKRKVLLQSWKSKIIQKSKKIQRVAKSTLAAKTLAVVETLEPSYMIRAILWEIYKKERQRQKFPIDCFTGSKLLLDSVHCTKTLKRKMLKVNVYIIRGMLEKKQTKLLR